MRLIPVQVDGESYLYIKYFVREGFMNRSKHVAIWIGILSLVFVLAAYGQGGVDGAELSYGGPPSPEEMALGRGELSGLGFTFINGEPFLRFLLQPEIDLGKVGFGLGLVLLYSSSDDGGHTILAEDGETWDDISTLLRVVRYVRYGHLSESFYTRFGALDYATIGHGFIMSGYSNYDRRGLRLNLSTETKKAGIETIINNVGAPTVFGGRMFVRPLQQEEGGIPLLNSLEFGATYLTDIEPDPYLMPEGDPLIALGVDIGFPLIHNKTLRLDVYDDVAFLNTKPGSKTEEIDEITDIAVGNAIGIGVSLSQALFKMEYRTFGARFYPTIFDYTYDAAEDIPDFWGMEEEDDEAPARRGYFSMIAVRPIPQVNFITTFEDYTNTEPKLYAGITESGIAQRASFRAFYVKRNIGEPDPGFPEEEGSKDPSFFEDLFRLDSKSAFIVRIGYEIFPRFEVAVLREYRFRRIESVTGKTHFEPIQKTTVEAGFRLNF